MKTSQKTKRPVNNTLKSESLEERVHRHLNDINSVITEDDIRNVKTETAPEPPAAIKKRKKRESPKQKKENETDTEGKQTTPWNILSEGYD